MLVQLLLATEPSPQSSELLLFLLYFLKILVIVWMCVLGGGGCLRYLCRYVCVYTCKYECPWRLERGIISPGGEITKL